MNIPFYKYHGTGNDFIMIDNRKELFNNTLPSPKEVQRCCHRRFGIGADGLILLQKHPQYDFEMVYFNADGNIGSMCGNGGRCTVAFANRLGIIGNETTFWANDGEHSAIIRPDGVIELKMQDVMDIESINNGTYFLHTGSPHYVEIVENLDEVPVVEWGRTIRYNERFKNEGTNVNFMQILNAGNHVRIATYERGVEDETYSCGTGATACAIIYALEKQRAVPNLHTSIQTKGGPLEVRFEHHQNHHFSNIWLCGPSEAVFTGHIEMHS